MSFNTSTKKEDVSTRLKAQNIKMARTQTLQLEMESKKMEDRLRELKLAMSKEKEQRERSGGGFWKSGKTGALTTHAQNVLNKPPDKPKDKKTRNIKVKVLRDEPVEVPNRNKQPGTMGNIAARSALPKGRVIKGPVCGQCEQKGAAVSCLECGEDYCAGCFASFHLKGNLKKHRSVPVQSNSARPVYPSPQPPQQSKSDGGSSTADVLTIDNSPSVQNSPSIQNGYASQNTYRASPVGASYDGPSSLSEGTLDEAAERRAFQEALQEWRQGQGRAGGKIEMVHEAPRAPQPKPPQQQNFMSPEPNQGGSLLDGNYDESASAASFQLALKEWRTSQQAEKGRPYSPVKTPTVNIDEGTGTAPEVKQEVDIKFSSNVSYAEKLLLKKHRRTDVGQLPSPGASPRSPRQQLLSDQELSARIDDDDEARVDFQALYQVMRKDEPQTIRAQSRVAIEEIKDDSSGQDVEQSSSYQVVEVDDYYVQEDIEGSTFQFKVKTEGTFDDISSRGSSASKMGIKHANKENMDYLERNQNNSKSQKDSNTRPPSRSAKPRPKSRTESRAERVKSATSKTRPVSRTKSAADRRPGSRTNSRSSSRTGMYGEGLLTKGPSDSLKEIARLAREEPTYEYKNSYSSSFGEFFTVGVQKVQEDVVMVPTSAKSQSRPQSAKVSNKLYQMAPRSWRPDSSLGENIPDQDVKMFFDDLHIQDFLTQPPMDSEPTEETVSFTLSEHVKMEKNSKPTTPGSRSGKQPTQQLAQSARKTQSRRPQSSDRPQSSGGTQSPAWAQSGKPTSSQSISFSRPTSATRPQSAFSESGRESRMIVVDGDDMSVYDDLKTARDARNHDDEETLNQLEWELASNTGRVTADGNISRLSDRLDDAPMSDDDDDNYTMPTLTQEDNLQLQLSENDLMDDFEEMEQKIMAEEVQALQ